VFGRRTADNGDITDPAMRCVALEPMEGMGMEMVRFATAICSWRHYLHLPYMTDASQFQGKWSR